MHWLIQTNLYSEENYDHLLVTLERLGLTYSIHRVIPFVGEVDPIPVLPDGTRVIVMGSYTLAKVAAHHNWHPGAYLDNLDFEVQRAHWGERMFNHDAVVTTFGEHATVAGPVFVRPTLDSKSFTGEVMDGATFAAWRSRILALTAEDHSTITADTRIMLCRPKEIWTETRTWIIDGRVVTASGYKTGSTARYTTPDQVDRHILEFAAACAAHWSPNRAYVLDVFDGPDGPRIGEVNNLNSAGWYRADMNKLVMALEDMPPAAP